ncbi:tape measure protein [Gordonia phage Dardanus]|uniref:Tape measure protein n=1 Tax=Gordonia phage Dardanus TaxID=2588489 RepID=A0A514CX17_9CAUD|nr:tail length tape measure protein [Gordonia phage Dardanus]QDH85059.1 tape measure protein [Gordonia phage Dardanus]
MANEDAIWIPVLPSMRDFGRRFASGLQGAARQGEREMGRAGQRAGDAYAGGVERARKQVERAAAALARARDKEADAAGKVRVAEEQLQALRDRGVTDAGRIAAAEERLASARRRSDAAAAQSARGVDELSRARARATNAANELGDSGREAGNDLDAGAQGAGRFTGALSNMALKAGGAIAAVAGVSSAMTSALEGQAGQSKLAAQLGATPAMAKEFGQMAGNLYAQAYGESLGDVNDALRGVWQQGLVEEDASTAEIERVTASVLNLSKAFDQDLAGATGAVGTMLKNGMAKDADEALDILTRGFQQGADKGQDLIDTFTEYPALFKGLGLSGQEAMGLINQAMNAGARNSDFVADALKEFQIRAQDGSKTSAEAYAALGLNAQEMTQQMAKGGESASAGLATVLEKLRAMPNEAERNAAAVGLFGTKAEDLGASLFALDPSTAVRSLGQVDGAAAKMGDTLRDNAATRVESFQRSLGRIATIGAGAIIGGISVAFEKVGNAAQVAVGFVKDNETTFTVIGGILGTILLPRMALAAIGYATTGAAAVASGAMQAGAWMAAQVGATAAAARTVAYGVAMGVVRGATIAWTAVQWLLNAAMTANPIGLVVMAIGLLVGAIVWVATKTTWFQTAWEYVWNAVKAAWDWVWNALKIGFNAFTGFFTDTIPNAVGAAKDWIVEKWEALLGFFTSLPGRVTSALGGLWDGLKEAFRGALNWIIEKWNNFSISMKVPDNIPLIGGKGFTIDTPNLPMLATGGVAGRRDGRLYGPGTGTSDSILGMGLDGMPTALVSAGEFVVNAKSTARFLPQLQALNAGRLPRFAEGGQVSADDLVNFAKGVEGKPYEWGGVNWGDCSGAVSAIANFATGRDAFGSRFATGTEGDELAKRGFKPGLGPEGSLNIGWFNGGPYGGHTSATLPNGVNFEMGGARGDGQYGGQAAGADHSQYTDHAHLPPEHFGGLDAGAPTSGDAGLSMSGSSGASSGGGFTGANIGGGTSSFGNSGGKSAFNSAKDARKGGVTVVWVENWPAGTSGSGSSDSSSSGALTGGAEPATGTPAPEASSTGAKTEPVNPTDPFVKHATGVDMQAVRDAQRSDEPWKPADAGSWFDDPQATALDALFEVLSLDDVLSAEDVLPDKVTRYGVAGPQHAAPVGESGAPGGEGGQKVVGTEVHGDVHVTDYDEFTKRQEQDQKNAFAKAGM